MIRNDLNFKKSRSTKKQIRLQQTAYHEAGHVAGVYRYKRHNNFPDSFFPDDIKLLCGNNLLAESFIQNQQNKIELPIAGERNITSPPNSLMESRKINPLFDKRSYQPAYRANIINLLAGPIAEAKYISLQDDESFNMLLFHVNALKFYNGAGDVQKACEHLDNCIHTQQRHHQKMPELSELFSKAFAFIDENTNWIAVASLANFILNNNHRAISCVEAFAVLDECVEILREVSVKAEKSRAILTQGSLK